MSYSVRDIRLPEDKSAILSFIQGMQHYEHAFEPDRRIDSAVAREYYTVLMDRVAQSMGRIFVAEENDQAIGWAAFVVEQNSVYVVEPQRTYGYIAELYVNERARSRGIGQALIAACETEARRLKLGLIMIGVLAGNRRTAEIYTRAGFSPYASELRKYL